MTKGLVIGFGSIGQRHARIMAELGIEVAVVSRRDISHAPRYRSIHEALSDYAPEYVVIASNTHEHHTDIQRLIDDGFTGKLLIEKPLFDRLYNMPGPVTDHAKVAYNLRFHPALQAFRKIVSECQVYAVHAYTGSYLPDWRPGTDYRQSYSAHKDMGGGVLCDLSHEIDYLLWTFGPWARIASMGSHYSHLEIDAEDVFSLLFVADKAPLISLQLNYLDTKPTRHVLALTDKGSVRLDLIKGTVETDGNTEQYEIAKDETYKSQHLAMMNGDSSVICPFNEGLEVMRMIDASKKAAETGVWISR